jgi:hypothetical protein
MRRALVPVVFVVAVIDALSIGCGDDPVLLATGGAPSPPDASDAVSRVDAADSGADVPAPPVDARSEDGPMEAVDAPPDVSDAPLDAPPVLAAPRPIAPLSTATATSQQPTFKWQLDASSDGAQVDICGDRACTKMVTSFLATGSRGAPPSPLAKGVYFWRLHGATGSVVRTETSPVWELFVPAHSAPVDTSWGSTLDYDGDGVADIVTTEIGGLNPGLAFVYKGSGRAQTGPFPVTTLGAPQGGDAPLFGAVVTSAGDMNGDGFPELLASDSDAAAVFIGGAAGFTPAGVLIRPPGLTSVRGLAGAGDVNGDGYADVVLASTWSGPDGTLWVYTGGPDGPTTSPTTISIPKYTQGTVVGGMDFNGDGYGDVVVSAATAAAVIHVFTGGPNGLSTPTTLMGGPDGGPLAAAEIAPGGDLNGDGFGDLLVGMPSTPTGFTDVLLGSPAGLSGVMEVSGLNGDQEFGAWLGGACDFNGDGYSDFVGWALYTTSPGFLALYLGGPAGPSSTPLLSNWLPSISSGQWLDMHCAGDVDGDGIDDLLMGYGGAGSETLVVYGSPKGFTLACSAIAGGDAVE